MAKIWAIAQRELKAYFVSPVAYVVAALFLLVSGYLFSLILYHSREASLRGLFSNLNVVFLLITPALTMRLLAEERQRGTIEMLMTSPVTDRDIVLGKYLSSLLYLAFLIALTGIYPLILAWLGSPDWMTVLTGYLAVYLLGASFMAIGLLTSSWTNNQVIAAVATFALSLLIWLLPSAGAVVGQPMSQVFEYLSLLQHQENLLRGVIDSADVIYYLSFIVGALFLTIRSVEVYRWR
jgi:ABC-2 type transport system permease protein